MFNIGPFELIVVFVVVLLVLGPKKLPELARTLGRTLGEFRRATEDLKTSLTIDLKSDHATPSPSQPAASEKPSPEADQKVPPEGPEREPVP